MDEENVVCVYINVHINLWNSSQPLEMEKSSHEWHEYTEGYYFRGYKPGAER